ncbi:hypothetical protein [Geotalea toluenoxydans]|uniref:hypothetical protein n=1 Tax=Geotalea toluenoxydans TaxID=421624 RepID=UPI0006D02E04|nr:hypothetical protein [Geotalea toluenoxydans]
MPPQLPPEGTIIAIDPDIPPENQLVFFEVENGNSSDLRWSLNGRLLSAGEEGRRWKPAAGRYELVLTDERGTRHDRVSFQVRGGDVGEFGAVGLSC